MGTGLIWARSCWGRFLIEATETLSRFRCSLNLGEVWGVELIKSILAVVEEMEGFPGREITFPINVVLEKWRTVSSIKLGIQDTVDIPSSIAILSNNRLSRFLLLARQGVSGYVTQKGGMKYWMDFHRCEKFELNYQRIPFKDTLNWKRTDMSVV